MEKANFKKYFEIFNRQELVWFDNSASTLKPKSVCDAVDYYNRYESANSGRGIYSLAYEVTNKVEYSRQKVAKFLSCESEEIIFNKNSTEGINTVALTYAKQIINAGDKIIVSQIEHHSNYLPWVNLAKNAGAEIVFCPLDENGKITLENFESVFDKKVKFVALNYVSNTLGYIAPIKEIIALSHKMGAKVLVDASQATAHKKIDVKDLDCDFLVFSGYKMFAPTGVGVLYGKKELLEKTQPLFFGGGMVLDIDENDIVLKEVPAKFEAGTLPISSIIGLGQAVDFVETIGWEKIEKIERELLDYLLKRLSSVDGVEIYSVKPDLPIIIFNLKGVHAHDASTMYDEFNICVRAGNHCASLVNKLINQIATIRISLAFYNTFEDIDKFIFATEQIIKFFTR